LKNADDARVQSARRIMICGCAGSGKSFLSRRLGGIFHLPVYHLDLYYWSPGWEPVAPAEFQTAVQKLATGDAWIIDGNYRGTFEPRADRADLIIYLDLPTAICLWRVFWRTLRGYRTHREGELPAGCHERFNREFFTYVATYRARYRPKMMEKLKPYADRTIMLGSRDDVAQFLQQAMASRA